jgi:hypothetical protein
MDANPDALRTWTPKDIGWLLQALSGPCELHVAPGAVVFRRGQFQATAFVRYSVLATVITVLTRYNEWRYQSEVAMRAVDQQTNAIALLYGTAQTG